MKSSPVPELLTSGGAAHEISCDALVVGAWSRNATAELGESAKNIDGRIDGLLVDFATDSGFRGKVGEVLILPTHARLPAKAIALVGLGESNDENAHRIRRGAAAAAKRLAERSSIASALHHEVKDSVEAAAEGFLLGGYKPPSYKKDPKPSKLTRIEMLNADAKEIERGVAHAEATIRARDLTNEPASVLTPDVFAQRARDLGDAGGIETEILDEQELEHLGFGGLLAVASGSANPPRLIRMNYKPSNAKGKVALVGKGVTFDSGGLSLKDARGMETMKSDMGGGAAVIGAMSSVARLNVPLEIVALVPATENMPSGTALRPGDVITHYGGRTTEVLNTDAEGRLILADALAFASEQKPDVIADVATLTGAMVVALGRKVAGVFATDDGLWEEIEAAAERSGEPMWRMPLFDGYEGSLDSDVADAKNIGGRAGGAIVAALFLKPFVGDGIPWIHMDIAGPARVENGDEIAAKGGTGVGARTLLAWLEGRSG